MKRFALILAFCALVSACETVKGLGRDIENLGEAVDNSL